MKIELDVEDLELFVTALNNATVAYHEVVSRIKLGVNISSRFKALLTKEEFYLDKQVNLLVKTVEKLNELERSIC